MNKNNYKDIQKIFSIFLKLIKKELKISDYHKFSEELLRYLFYKSLLMNNIKNEEIIFEANFTNNTIDKVDMKFQNNFLEIKFHRELENGNQRPFPYGLGKVFADFFKLSNININEKKYFLYIFDKKYENYINKNNLDFLFQKSLEIKKEFLINNFSNTLNKQIKNFSNKLKFKANKLFNEKIDNLTIILYEIN